MTRLENLQGRVGALYSKRHESRDNWADWLYPNHVLVVTKNAKKVAKRVDADIELSQAAALLHVIADAVMKRDNPTHITESLAITRTLMQDCSYSDVAIRRVTQVIERCRVSEPPESPEGRVFDTADGMAHLQTDFYLFITWEFAEFEVMPSLANVKAWTLKKIDDDFYRKISFEDIREEVRPDYETVKTLFSR